MLVGLDMSRQGERTRCEGFSGAWGPVEQGYEAGAFSSDEIVHGGCLVHV